jgi:hypothetical protein
LYIALVIRDDTGGVSEIPFVVRNDSGHSAIQYQTSDATWEAYNAFNPTAGSQVDSGNSLYQCSIGCPPGNPGGYKGAFAVSYNRPLQAGAIDAGRDGPFYAEFPMITFLEQNGYDVSYTTEADVDSSGSLLLNHGTLVTSGHDEYWSANQRASFMAARDHGVNLAFFTGNESFWKTQYQTSPVDGTPERTIVSYKETHFDPPIASAPNVVDPSDPPTWTGTWRDPYGGSPDDGNRPENQLTGQYFMVNAGTTDIKAPYQYAKLQLWRNTSVANLTSGSQPVTLGSGIGTLGYEWDIDADNGFRPAGEIDLSATTEANTQSFSTDYGTNVRNRC